MCQQLDGRGGDGAAGVEDQPGQQVGVGISAQPAGDLVEHPLGGAAVRGRGVCRQRRRRQSCDHRCELQVAHLRTLEHRAKLDGNKDLETFATTLEKVCIDTVEAGYMTKDLALLVGAEQRWLSTTGFLDRIDENLKKAMA